jgi:hypothetical protein
MEGKGQRQQQRQTAKEVIAANVQHLIEQLEQCKSEALTTSSSITATHRCWLKALKSSRKHPPSF